LDSILSVALFIYSMLLLFVTQNKNGVHFFFFRGWKQIIKKRSPIVTY
jgi:uncharacterized integral membrane protein